MPRRQITMSYLTGSSVDPKRSGPSRKLRLGHLARMKRRLHDVSCVGYSSTLKTQAINTSEKPADFHQIAQRYIPEDRIIRSRRCENIRSTLYSWSLFKVTWSCCVISSNWIILTYYPVYFWSCSGACYRITAQKLCNPWSILHDWAFLVLLQSCHGEWVVKLGVPVCTLLLCLVLLLKKRKGSNKEPEVCPSFLKSFHFDIEINGSFEQIIELLNDLSTGKTVSCILLQYLEAVQNYWVFGLCPSPGILKSREPFRIYWKLLYVSQKSWAFRNVL
jgi:hypothetical protein